MIELEEIRISARRRAWELMEILSIETGEEFNNKERQKIKAYFEAFDDYIKDRNEIFCVELYVAYEKKLKDLLDESKKKLDKLLDAFDRLLMGYIN